jgi:hypothetical protein
LLAPSFAESPAVVCVVWSPGENPSSFGAGGGGSYAATFLKAPPVEASTLWRVRVCVSLVPFSGFPLDFPYKLGRFVRFLGPVSLIN